MMHFVKTEGITFDDVQIVPLYSDVEHRSEVDISTRLVGDIRLDIPLIPANMDTISSPEMSIVCTKVGSICFVHRFMSVEEQLTSFVKGSTAGGFGLSAHIGFSVGASKSEQARIKHIIAWYENKAKEGIFDVEYRPLILMLDVAHAHHKLVKEAIEFIKNLSNCYVIAGNISNKVAAKDLIEWGADSLVVGIGGGSLCETRIRTGVGIPQMTAISNVSEAISEYEYTTLSPRIITLIADGGIKYPGDIAKAIAAGADCCMSGALFAGTEETPGRVVKRGPVFYEKSFKEYRGSASSSSKEARGEYGHIEGASKFIEARGSASEVFQSVGDGLKSAYSYVGARTTEQFQSRAFLQKVSNSSIIEARPNFLER
jgi:IMP dehydrogenase